MSAREQLSTVRCAEADCREVAHYSYANKTEAREAAQRRAKQPWLCTRHRNPDAVLSVDNAERTAVVTATPGTGIISDTLFWHDGERLGSGFTYGPGFKAFASDFPAGTRLVITARIEVPS